MANKFIKNCITKDEIGEEIYHIKGSLDYYITKSIKIYKYYADYGYYEMNQTINKYNGYSYCSIKYEEGYKLSTKRVHRIVALTFIENEDEEINLLVGHKNNIKHDNRIDNLYWTTNQENTNKAIDDGLSVKTCGADNKMSKPILVTDLDNNIVAVYGGIRETSRMIENIDISYLSKTIRDYGNDYKPRNKRYKYFSITKEEYDEFNNKYKNIKLIENAIGNKQYRVFIATNLITKEEIISDNQKKFAQDHNLKQASISQALIKGNIHNNWKFEVVKNINYSESSGYENFINSLDSLTIQHINTGEILYFENAKKLKEYFNMTGHDLKQYVDRGNLLFSRWKIIKVNEKIVA